MTIDKDTVTKIAKLARIDIDDSANKDLVRELSAIMAWVDQLSEVPTEGVDPMTSVVDNLLPQREDHVKDITSRDDLLANAPSSERGYFVVPKVVE